MTDAALPNALMKFHGSLMVTGWLGSAMIGLIAVRYLKKSFVGKKLLESEVWYAFHFILMMITLSCTAIGVFLIMVQLDVWFKNLLHAILGWVTMVFTFFQMLALGQPSPENPFRECLRYWHMGAGTITFVVAMAAVFTGMNISSMQMPQWTKMLLYTSYAVFLGTSGIMTLLDYLSRRSEESFNNWRKPVFFVFALVCIGLAFAIVIGININRR